MRLVPFLRLVLVTIIGFVPTTSHAATDDQIVASMYPSSLLADPILRGTPPTEQTFVFTRADLDGKGANDYIVAQYYNGIHGDLRVLHVQNGAASVAYDLSSMPYIARPHGEIEALDLDGDGKPEIHLSFQESRGTADWLFKWKNGQLVPLGPSRADGGGAIHTSLWSLVILDIDGDGIPELLVPADHGASHVYGLASGKYTERAPVYFFRRIERTTGDPDVVDLLFDLPQAGTYSVRIVNGDGNHTNRVTSALLELNDQGVFGENDFKQANHILSKSVPLTAGTNSVYMEVRGDPGCAMTVSVSKQ